MTDAAYTHLTILADRTGSMAGPADSSRGTVPPYTDTGPSKAELTTKGIHALIHEQAVQPGRITFSLVQFDTTGTDRVASFAAADDPAITRWKIVPRSGTNLLDAVGTLIVQLGEHLAALPEGERPGKVYVVIGTDGEENSSKEYTRDRIAAMVAAQREKYGWDFVFIGADIDAFAEAGGMGVPRHSTLDVLSVNTVQAYAGTSSAISRSRAGGQSVSYTEEERKQAGG